MVKRRTVHFKACDTDLRDSQHTYTIKEEISYGKRD